MSMHSTQQTSNIGSSMTEGGEHVWDVDELKAGLDCPPELYSVEEVAGKGEGCLARRTIACGSLVLRERPCCMSDPGRNNNRRKIETFLELGKEGQENYLKLANKFDTGDWSNQMTTYLKAFTSEWEDMAFRNITKKTAVRVWQIWETNSFHNGVCLQMSRFNHSCQPSAEYFWNEDTETRDLRAVRVIEEGEEITIDYRGWEVETTEERRKVLKEAFNFDCGCIACDISEENMQREMDKCEMFKAKKLQIQELKKLGQSEAKVKKEAKLRKDLYNLSKDIATFGQIKLLENIIEECFDVSCQGYASECMSLSATEDDKDDWMKDVVFFASIGLVLASTIYGEDYYIVKEWQKRKEISNEHFVYV